jgi:hypothetical protein
MMRTIAAAVLLLTLVSGCRNALPLNVNVQFQSTLPTSGLGQKLALRVDYSLSNGQQGIAATILPDGR